MEHRLKMHERKAGRTMSGLEIVGAVWLTLIVLDIIL